MNVTFVYSNITIERVNNKYYHNFLGDIILRYSQLGALTGCTSVRIEKTSKQNEINLANAKIIEINKENTIKNIFDRRYNKRVIKKAVKSCDLLIIHTPDSVGDMAARYAKRFSKPVLSVVIGCVWDSLWNHSWKGKLLAIPSFFNMKKTVKNADYVMYVTNRFLQNRYPTNGKHIGCSDVVIEENETSVCEKRKERFAHLKKSDEIKIATIGGLGVSYKGQQYIIKALKTLIRHGWNYHYYLIGGGDKKYLSRLASRLGIEKHIHFLGTLKHDDINNCLINMDIYAQPSKQEGLPRSVVEAMNTAIPCIGSDIGGIPELLPSELLFKKGNINAIIGLLEVEPSSWGKYVDYSFGKAKDFLPQVLNKRRNDFLEMIASEITKRKHL